MMQELKQYIGDKKWQAILDLCQNLDAQQRDEAIAYLHSLNIDRDILQMEGHALKGQERTDFYANRQKVDATLNLACIACTRNFEDYKKTEKTIESWTYNPFLSYFSNPVLGLEPVMEFYKAFPPDYLEKVVKAAQQDRFRNIDFKLLWNFYQQGWISFDEPYFVRQLFNIVMFNRNTIADARFLLDNPEAMERIFIQFYRYEIPVLDISKWTSRTGFVCKKICEFWTEVFQILQEEGYVFERSIVLNLLESLLNNWKKPHLDWHIRLLDLLKTSPAEYLAQQDLLFSLLNTGQVNLINFAVKKIGIIYQLPGFNEQAFIDNIPAIFAKEKIEKTILSALDILDVVLAKPAYQQLDINDQLAVLLLQTDPKVQERSASMLARYVNDPEVLQELSSPYRENLKSKALEILGLNPSIDLEAGEGGPILTETAENLNPIEIPGSWEALLFQIGHFIRTKSALDLDIFLEGLNQLQDEIPTDYRKQLKPYSKQLFARFWDTDLMIFFSEFMQAWVGENEIAKQRTDNKVLPFVKEKLDWMLQKLIAKNKLPFLSTPSHEPFYITPQILVERLFQYETEKQTIEIGDLIVACNRTLYKDVNKATLQQVKQLSGPYAKALQYFFGVSDQLAPEPNLLPLWTQISRIKHPDGIFNVFDQGPAAAYPSVVKPFEIDFNIVVDKNEYATWHRLVLEGQWNYTWYNGQASTYLPVLFYHTAPFAPATREAIAFQMTLMPQYLDPLLCRYIPHTASGNEVTEFEQCLYPLQFLLEHRLKVYHSGWIYIAVCLLFEKKVTRDLAAEYIQFSLLNLQQDLNYLALVIGRLIAAHYAPVNRLIEYLDRSFVSIKIKTFQLLILEHCLLQLDPEKLPVNSKKIKSYYIELSGVLSKETNKLLLDKVKSK